MGNLKNKKTIPTFNKPSTSLNTEHGREWKHVPVQDLAEGDIVAGLGLVHLVQPDCRGQFVIEAGVPESNLTTVETGTIFFAFVKKG